MDPNEFKQSTKDKLAQRAGHKCSNPWCAQTTSGPHSIDDKSVSIGEAAHIRGAHPGSARYDATMTSEERSVITNGIWLCRRCARLIDADAPRYAVDILYKWKRTHESAQAAAIGADPGELEQRDRTVRLFAAESPAAMQLAADKPEFWEYLLTIELIRDKLTVLRQRLHEIEEGMVHRPATIIDLDQIPTWVRLRLADIVSLIGVLSKITTKKIPSSWGPNGMPGDAGQILRATELLSDACGGLLEWEQEVARAVFPDGMDDLRQRMRGWTHGMFVQMERIPESMSGPMRQRTPGVHMIKLLFEPPADMEVISQEIVRRYHALRRSR